LLFAALQVMPIEWKPATDYDDRRHDAEQRIGARDPDDWPTVALALTVWSQDKDLATAGLDVYTTGDLLDALRDAGQIEQHSGTSSSTVDARSALTRCAFRLVNPLNDNAFRHFENDSSARA
jgi:hypothetical protein